MPSHSHAVRIQSSADQSREQLRAVLDGPRGGDNRRRILRILAERPRNANRLATDLGLDYKTVRHHLAVLEEADAVSCGGKRYGTVYVSTPRVRQHWDLVDTH